MPADAPLLVVNFLKGQERQPKLLNRVAAANPEKIFLEDADKAFGDAVALRLPHVRRRILYAQELDFILKIVRDELAAVIMEPSSFRIHWRVVAIERSPAEELRAQPGGELQVFLLGRGEGCVEEELAYLAVSS